MKILAVVLTCFVLTQASNRNSLVSPHDDPEIEAIQELSRTDGKIVGGTQVTDEKKHPYHIWIGFSGKSCSGNRSLIKADTVITVASCVDGQAFLEITAGDIDKDINTGNEQARNATSANVKFHPDWYNILDRADLAIITLPIPFNLNEYVNVITIDGEDSTHNLHAGEVGTFVGFGKTTDVSNTSPVLNEIDDILIITQELCKYTYGLLLHAGEICTDTADGKGPCGGDSGAPLTQELNGRRILIGMVSQGHSSGCIGYPVENTRISVYRSWIDSVSPGLP